MSKFQRAILFSVAGLVLLLLASSIYFFAATGGDPVSQSDIDTLKARVGAVEIESNYAAVKADSAYDYVVALGSFCNGLQESGTKYGTDIESIKKQIEILKNKNGAIDKKARADIEKLKNIWQGNTNYIAKRDSISSAEAAKTKSMIDSLISASKPAGSDQVIIPGDKKLELPTDEPGKGQDYPKKKKGKKKEYLPKNNDPGSYQNFNKAPVN